MPSFGKSTDVSAIDECLQDVVAQDDNVQITYEAPGSVALVDDGEYEPPIQPQSAESSSRSRRSSPLARRIAMRMPFEGKMYVDQSAPQGAASVMPRLPNEYFYNGVVHRMMPLNPRTSSGDKNVKFNHGDLNSSPCSSVAHELKDHP